MPEERIPDYNDDYVKDREINTIKEVNRLVGKDYYITRNPDPYKWDALVYKYKRYGDYVKRNFCGYVELEHAEKGDKKAYLNFPVCSLLSKKFFYLGENGYLTDNVMGNIDRCLYLKYSSDFKFSFIINMGYVIEMYNSGQVERKRNRERRPFYGGMKYHQDDYLLVNPNEFIIEYGENILTKRDKCITYIKDFFSDKTPLKYGKKRRKIRK
ncbi:MAG: hypothetical protein ACOC1K_06865 [Nanoarchaeota archaeon]